MGDFGTFCMFICIMCHFFISVSDHGKCGIKSMPTLYYQDISGLIYSPSFDDTVNVVSIRNESFHQISVRLWQMFYQIEHLNCGSQSVLGIFSDCHGNGNQELVKNIKIRHYCDT